MSHRGTISKGHLMNGSSLHNNFHTKDKDDFMFLSNLVMSTYLLSVPPMGIISESFSVCAPQRMMERCWFWWCAVWRVTCHRCQVSRTWSRGTTTSNRDMTSGCRGIITSSAALVSSCWHRHTSGRCPRTDGWPAPSPEEDTSLCSL